MDHDAMNIYYAKIEGYIYKYSAFSVLYVCSKHTH